jgi:ferritin-like metal-binding protein YciE
MAKGASSEELANAFREHLEVTGQQVQRLESIFESLGMKAKSKPCKGMKGIVEEAREIMEEAMEPGVLDTALATAGRKVEHYEMIGYEAARAVAMQLGRREAASLLEATLQEKTAFDRTLVQLSRQLLKQPATGAEDREESGQRSASRKRSGGQRGGSAEPLTDHERIRRWADERSAHPACVRGTGGKGGIGMIRLDFPGYSGADSLDPISWDQWFQAFDENGLALSVQEKTTHGQRSNFNKLVSRETAAGGERRPKTRAAH